MQPVPQTFVVKVINKPAHAAPKPAQELRSELRNDTCVPHREG
jgi:hypothetical protein